MSKIVFQVDDDEDYKVDFTGEELTLIMLNVCLFILYNPFSVNMQTFTKKTENAELLVANKTDTLLEDK